MLLSDVERADDLGGKPLVPSTAHTQDAGSSSSAGTTSKELEHKMMVVFAVERMFAWNLLECSNLVKA
ncbi:hypothetical protein PI124_g4817 [Phytophthora idaei]|nr:hypothetical protein PI125_g2330 [Phytophthora idaei]KAG3165740.1 hypothetical protein PI126_g4511 [Phytophthora idaei]KAG3250560.1 hypothetical protein PI124_g4817 [Phytophthora idaei]